MELINKRSIDITTLALDGLSARHNIISANIANERSPGYKRADVNFEDQLAKIIENDNVRQNSRINSAGISYSPSTFDTRQNGLAKGTNGNDSLKTDIDSFKPEIATNDSISFSPDGNNVHIEYEMAELSKNGTKYTAISTMQEKMFRGMQDLIKGLQ